MASCGWFLPLSFLTVLELKIVSGMKPKSTEDGNSRKKEGGVAQHTTEEKEWFAGVL